MPQTLYFKKIDAAAWKPLERLRSIVTPCAGTSGILAACHGFATAPFREDITPHRKPRSLRLFHTWMQYEDWR